MSEHKARAAAKFRRPTKALAVQKFDFKYLFEPATSFYTAGMCDVFNRITPANVRIVYTQPAAPAGLGFAGRPGGPVPTIKISLQNMPFRFFFLGDLLGFRDMQIPSAATTMTGEDLYSCSPIMRRGCSGSH